MKYAQARHRRSTLPGVCKERVFFIVAITNPFNNTVGTTRKEINTYENIFSASWSLVYHKDKLLVHHKDKLFTVLDYLRNFGNAAKEGLMRKKPLGSVLFKNTNPWHPVPERTRFNNFVFYSLDEMLFVSLILTCLYQYDCPWSKSNERKSLPWLAYVIRVELLIDIIILVKGDKRKPYGDHRLQRINTGWENHLPPKRSS